SLRTPQRRTHLVHVQLHDRALLALLRLERTRLQPALHNHPRAPSQRLRNVLTLLTPRRTPEEQRLPIPELVGLPVEYAWRARHREVRNRRTIRREPHLRISRQIPYHRDHCFAAHALQISITRVPRVSDSATFSPCSRHVEHRRNNVSPSLNSLACRSNTRGVLATVKFATAVPFGANRISGSAVRFPTTVITVSPLMLF